MHNLNNANTFKFHGLSLGPMNNLPVINEAKLSNSHAHAVSETSYK
jgi:hypothetical protein